MSSCGQWWSILRAEAAIIVGGCALWEQIVRKLAETHSRERIPVAHQGGQQHDSQYLSYWVFLEAAALSEMLKLDVEVGQKGTKEPLTKQSVSMSWYV